MEEKALEPWNIEEVRRLGVKSIQSIKSGIWLEVEEIKETAGISRDCGLVCAVGLSRLLGGGAICGSIGSAGGSFIGVRDSRGVHILHLKTLEDLENGFRLLEVVVDYQGSY